MPRDSNSSPRWERSDSERQSGGSRYHGGYQSKNRYETNPRRQYESEDRGHANMLGRDDRRRDYGSRYSGEYGERERERERQRDRNRYDQRERDVARRSASPRHSRSALSRDGSPADTDKSKGKPNFAHSGLLAAETNTVKASNGENTVLKYNEPPEARRPTIGWRLYVFKGEEQTDLLHIHKQSAYLIGRDRIIADIAIEHPSCSKQHAAIQYRFVHEKNEFGETKGVIKPYVIDLESTNGTHVNGITIPASRFYELKAGDVIKFGTSSREYVLLHDEAT